MIKRIISGIVMAIIVAGVFLAGEWYSPLITVGFVALMAAVAVYELLHNAAGIKNKLTIAVSCIYTGLLVITLNFTAMNELLGLILNNGLQNTVWSDIYKFFDENSPYTLTVLFFIFAVIMILKHHKDFDLGKIVSLCAMPILLGYAFSALLEIVCRNNGIYYLLLLLNFSSVCDMGAYFVGVTIGKHKLCPEISPKKTVEGAIGGLIFSIGGAIGIMYAFGYTRNLLPTIIFTIPLCILGMLGDLFASSIKRSVGIKDYGNLIPGHGGVLDRVDSILLIAPLLHILIENRVI